MRTLIRLTCKTLSLALMLTLPAAAATIDFESVPTSVCAVHGLQLTTQGFTFWTGGDGVALATCDGTDPYMSDNGSNWLSAFVEGGFTPPIFLAQGTSAAAGPPFALLAFDASELIIATPGEALKIQGFDASDVLVAEHTVVFDGVIDGQGGADDFETFTLPPAFGNVSYVLFWAGELPGPNRYFAVDDLVVAAPVPAVPTLSPWSQMVLLTGLLVTALASQRRRAAWQRISDVIRCSPQ